MILMILLAFVFSTNTQSIPRDLLIKLGRGAGLCSGICGYDLSVTSDGAVVIDNVVRLNTKGLPVENKPTTIKTVISPQKLQELMAEIDKIKFFSLKDAYTCNMLDGGGASISIRIDGKSKKISYIYGCNGQKELDDLIGLEKKIDEIVNTAKLLSPIR